MKQETVSYLKVMFIFSLSCILLAFLTLKFIGKPIDIVLMKEMDFVEYLLNNKLDAKLPSKVTIDKENNILISIDAFVADTDACRALFEKIHIATTDYIHSCSPRLKKRKVPPFIITAKNITITIP